MAFGLTLFVGLAVGLLSKFFMPGRDPGGVLFTALIGVTGAFLSRWAGSAVGLYREGATGPGFLASVGGALLILLAYRLLAARGHPVQP